MKIINNYIIALMKICHPIFKKCDDFEISKNMNLKKIFLLITKFALSKQTIFP